MLNAGYKKEALKKCGDASRAYKEEYDATIEKSKELYEDKESAVKILKEVDDFVHTLSNKPKEIEKTVQEVSVRRQAFENDVKELKLQSENADKAGNGITGAGVLAGAGIAAFGPSAAMGVATTFGTASTGTAIATLSGAAQTNAALAWLGGGAIGTSASAGGMAAGEAFLAMAGPVGWAIGGAALIGGGLLKNSKNKKVAEKAEAETKKIKKETTKLSEIKTKIIAEIKAIVPLNAGVKNTLDDLGKIGKIDYKLFTNDEKAALMEIVNSAEALSERIGVKIA